MGATLDVLKQLLHQVQRDNVPILAAALAYRFFLAVFPFLIFVAALGAFVAGALSIQNPADQVIGAIGNVPGGVADILRDELQSILDQRSPALLSIGIVGAVIAATSGINAAIKAMNVAYDVEETRPLWQRVLLAVGMTVLSGVLMILVLIITLVGVVAGGQLAQTFGLQGVWVTVVQLLRWPATILLLMLAVAVLYHTLPNLDIPWTWVIPGTVLFTLGWLAATAAFSFYVRNFGTYSATYGALGGVVVLLIWFYITAFALLLGAELNAILNQREDPDALERQRRQRRQEREESQEREEREEAPSTESEQPQRKARAASVDVPNPAR